MAVGDFDNFYPINPWANVATNQRDLFNAVLLSDFYRKHVIYNRFVTTQINLGDVRAKNMTLTKLIAPHANFNQTGLRQIWLPSSYIDSAARDVTFARYSGKLSLNEYDDMVTYWQSNGAFGLKPIINGATGPQMVAVFERVARNTFLSNSFKMMGAGGTATGFNQITSLDTMSSDLIEDIHLGMAERGVPYADNLDGRHGNIPCITTPGIVQTIRKQAGPGDWIDAHRYADQGALINGLVGSWRGVDFYQTNDACLYNCGTIYKQVNITGQIHQGDGSPDPTVTLVDSVFKVGQTSGVTHYVQTAGFSVGDFKVNDYVTIHVGRTNANGVTNGVDYTDGKAHNRRIVAVDQPNGRIALDQPILEDFTTDLGSGVYGYVTKGRHIHTATFVGGSDGVVQGVGRPPRVHTPKPIDDTESIYRVAWDAYLGYNLFEPAVFEVFIGAGPNRMKGPTVR
jgi:hypothetical protein